MLPHEPADDLVEPGGERPPAVLVAVDLLQGSKEDRGGHVVHVGRVVAERVRDARADPGVVLDVQGAERLAVSRLGAADQVGVVGVAVGGPDVLGGRGSGEAHARVPLPAAGW